MNLWTEIQIYLFYISKGIEITPIMLTFEEPIVVHILVELGPVHLKPIMDIIKENNQT